MEAKEEERGAALERLIGVKVRDAGLLEQAFVHRSYLNENPGFPLASNERLEFLGDAVLGLVAADLLYHRLPRASEGDLTRLRAALVRGRTLARVAANLGLGRQLLLGRGEASSGGSKRHRVLAAAFEAVVGAIFVDGGWETAAAYVTRFLEPELDRVLAENQSKDAKSRLQELAQGQLRLTPAYRIVAAEGPDHAKTFDVVVEAGETVLGSGQGASKQEAEQAAARDALARWPAS